MLSQIFILIVLLVTVIHGTTVQVWDANNKLLDSVSECNTNYFPPSNTHRFYVEYGGQWVDWYNADDNFIFYSSSSGYVNYGTSGNAANNLMIDC
jgi:hypothetical protein